MAWDNTYRIEPRGRTKGWFWAPEPLINRQSSHRPDRPAFAEFRVDERLAAVVPAVRHVFRPPLHPRHPAPGVVTDNLEFTTDSDGDGIPDAGMIQYFGHPAGLAADLSRAQDDADADGLTNLQEYQRGTLPKNPDTDGDGLKDKNPPVTL